MPVTFGTYAIGMMALSGVPLFFSSRGLYIRDVSVNVPGEGDQTHIKRFAELMGNAPQPMDDLYTGVGEVEAWSKPVNDCLVNPQPFGYFARHQRRLSSACCHSDGCVGRIDQERTCDLRKLSLSDPDKEKIAHGKSERLGPQFRSELLPQQQFNFNSWPAIVRL